MTALVSWFATYQQSYQMTRVGQFALYDVASDMFRHIAKLSLKFFDRNETGRIMARVQSDVNVLQNLLSQGLISTVGNMISVFGILAVMFAINWRLAALTSTSVPVFVLAILLWQGFARRSFRRARATISVVNASLQENVSGVRVIQSLGREERNSREFDRANTANLDANLSAGRVAAAAQPIVELTSAMSLVLVLFFGGKMVIDGSLTIGQLVSLHAVHRPLLRPDTPDHAAVHAAPARHDRRRAHLRDPRYRSRRLSTRRTPTSCRASKATSTSTTSTSATSRRRGAARLLAGHPCRRARGRRWPDRRWQEHPGQPAHALLRRDRAAPYASTSTTCAT